MVGAKRAKQRRSKAAFGRGRGGRGRLTREVWARGVGKEGKMDRSRRGMWGVLIERRQKRRVR